MSSSLQLVMLSLHAPRDRLDASKASVGLVL